MAAAKAIRDEYKGKGAPMAHAVKMNQVITDVPFGEGTIEAHMDSSSGEMEMDIGHIESPDVTVTLDYATAKAIFVEGNPQAGMQAFMSGKIKVAGDMTKLMAMQSGAADPVAEDRRQDRRDHRIASTARELRVGSGRTCSFLTPRARTMPTVHRPRRRQVGGAVAGQRSGARRAVPDRTLHGGHHLDAGDEADLCISCCAALATPRSVVDRVGDAGGDGR